MVEVPSTFSLKELRARKNETQQQVAAAVGVSTATYNAWEKDISKATIGKVRALAEHFGVPMGQISLTPQHEFNSCT